MDFLGYVIRISSWVGSVDWECFCGGAVEFLFIEGMVFRV